MSQQVKIEITEDMKRRLKRMAEGDTDTSDKHALEHILWVLAEKAGIVDANGNIK